MTSASSLDYIDHDSVDLSRNIDGAARDVEAAISGPALICRQICRQSHLPKVNPADAPIMIIGLTSSKFDKGKLYDVASTVMSQKLSQIQGVGASVCRWQFAAFGARRCQSYPTQ